MAISPTTLKTLRLVALWALSLLLVVALLPLLGAVAFLSRPIGLLLVATGALALVGSARLRAWLSFEEPEIAPPAGVSLPPNVSIHPQHGWACRVARDHAHVGVDHLLQRALGPVDRIETPEAGTFVNQGQPLFRLTRGERTVEVRAPISGTVVAANRELASRPELLALDPYGEGWVLELRAPHYERDRCMLHQHPRTWSFLAEELDRLLALATPQRSLAPALHDGGDPAHDFHRQIDDAAWREINRTVFGARAAREGGAR